MKFIKTQVYEVPDFDYFKEQLGWDFCDDMEDVFDNLKNFDEKDLSDILGLPDEYYEIK